VLVPPERRNMSMIFQSYAVWPHMTVFQNVAYGLKLKKLSHSDIEEKAERLLRIVHLDSLKGRYPGELSGGQQQRVALARALAVEPEILLLDEPLSNLDANLREEMRFEIRRLHEEFAITTIYVTHDQAEAMVASDRIAVMNKGKIVQAGTPAEIFDHPSTRFVAEFIGKTNILRGQVDARQKIALAEGLRLAVAAGAGAAKGEVFVCVRPHNIILTGNETEARALTETGYNVLAGVVQRRTYFGDAIDYAIDLAPYALQLRAVTAPSQSFDKGQSVFAAMRPEHCIVLNES
jgi:iron(III) transport system ATP-binding protein